MRIRLFVICLFIGGRVFATVSLPKIFSDGMVLQRNAAVKIWGTASENEGVTVSFHGQVVKTTASASGHWSVVLEPMKAGGPYTLEVKGASNTVSFTDVLLGDVWVCSGQSNMEFPVKGWSHVNNADEEIKNADYPSIRLFSVEKAISPTAQSDVKGGHWEHCSPATISPFSAVGYFFGRELYATLKVPIGLINTTWGGTDIESWTSRNSLDSSVEFRDAVAHLPIVNIDSLKAFYRGRSLDLVKRVQGGLPDAASVAAWKDASFDASRWPVMKLPGVWEDRQLPNLDGVVWFRKEVDVPVVGDNAELSFGMIDDNDETYINGVRVGATNGYNLRRQYKIAPGVLHAGKNVIAVMVTDGGGNGGIYGNGDDLYLSVGGSRTSLVGDWSFQVASIISGDGGFGPNSYPSLLYNAMINPLIPYGIKGAIWYQGENNASRAYQYRSAMTLLIEDWRNHWAEGNFPFYFVQLTSFKASNGNSNKGSTWAELRESQRLAALGLPHSGMVVTTDVGDPNDIHPKDKQDVGKRLAMMALHRTYGVGVGPVYKSVAFADGKAIVTFSDGVISKGGVAQGFEIAGADNQFYPAVAVIEGRKVSLSSDKVSQPVAVRYAWMDDASGVNLFDAAGYPVAPFRTDDWPLSTRDVKYRIN